MNPSPKSVKEGVAEGVHTWIAMHDVTTTYAIQDGVKAAVTDWLNLHGDDLVKEAVREVMRERR